MDPRASLEAGVLLGAYGAFHGDSLEAIWGLHWDRPWMVNTEFFQDNVSPREALRTGRKFMEEWSQGNPNELWNILGPDPIHRRFVTALGFQEREQVTPYFTRFVYVPTPRRGS